MSSTEVDPAMLDTIARRLADTATAVDGCAADAPTSVDAGEATDAALDVLSLLCEIAGRLVVGASSSSEQVTGQKADYASTEGANTVRVDGSGG